MIKYISQSNKNNFENKKVFLRLDLNVPIKNGVITSDFRIQKSVKTLNFLKDIGAKTVIVSHIKNKEGNTLYPVYEYLKREFSISFVEDVYDNESIDRALLNSDFVLIENIRNWEGEKSNDSEFAQHLANLGEVYINDAFSVSHRDHASIVSVPKLLPSYAGFQIEEEINSLNKVSKPKHPFTFILGGAKFETKVPLIEKYGKKADLLYICGALANDVYKIRGHEIGKSLVGSIDVQKYIKNINITVPEKVIVQGETVRNTSVDSVREDESIMDADPESVSEIRGQILDSKMIVWNGPLGLYEKGFTEGTKELAKLIAESDAYSVVGGGDTISAITYLGLLDSFSFISTGGGAMLQYLTDGTLVGLEGLKRKSFLNIFKIFRS